MLRTQAVHRRRDWVLAIGIFWESHRYRACSPYSVYGLFQAPGIKRGEGVCKESGTTLQAACCKQPCVYY